MNNNKYSTRALCEVGILTAITVILGLIATYVDVLGIVGFLIMPIPVSIIYIKYGFKLSLTSIVINIIICLMLMNPISVVSNAIIYTIVGIVIGYMVKHENTPFKIIIVTGATYAITYIISILFYMSIISGQGVIKNITIFIDSIVNVMNDSMNYVISYYKSMGINDKQLEAFDNIKLLINKNFIMAIFPSFVVIYGLLSGFISYIICRSVFNKLRIKKLESFYVYDLYISNIVGAILIGLTAIAILLSNRKIQYMDVIYTSLLYITMFLMLINGIASVVYFLKKKRNTATGVIVFIIIASLLLGLESVLSSIGFVEMMCDFRRLDPYSIRKR